jgi:hypothetical protein
MSKLGKPSGLRCAYEYTLAKKNNNQKELTPPIAGLKQLFVY